MSTLLVTHSCFVDHDTGPGHPECGDRMRAVDKALSGEAFAALKRIEAPYHHRADAAIIETHGEPHLSLIVSAHEHAQRGGVRFDPDTVMTPRSFEAIRRAVGAGLQAVDEVMTGQVSNAFCQVRPPGHHAERERAMGFCFFNSIAIAAMYARKAHGAERVAVVDFDVHHGNGTQDIFWSDKDLFLGSTHQMPLYPGTGGLSETGVGNIFNAPLRPGDGGEAFREAFESRIIPAVDNFAPDLILVSAGFDAHRDDPLANLELDETDFIWATQQIAGIAHRHAHGRIVSMLEGGYDLAALARSAAGHVQVLMDAGG